jgi:hypothetical protein
MYSHQLAIDKIQVTYWAVIICANTADSAPESCARDILVSRPIQSTRDGSYELLNLGTASLTMGLDLAGSSGFPSSAQGARDKLYGRFSACSMPRLHTPASDGIRRRTRTIRSTQSLYEYKKNAYFELGPTRISFRKLNCSGV